MRTCPCQPASLGHQALWPRPPQVVTNVRHQVQQIYRGSQAVLDKVQAGELAVVGAFYEISSGMVDFVDTEGICAPCK